MQNPCTVPKGCRDSPAPRGRGAGRLDPAAANSGGPVRGFTLIELLVVISITALLIGILLPALGGTRDVATRVTCAANMRQLGAGVHLYANDQDDERARGPVVVHDFLAPFGAL